MIFQIRYHRADTTQLTHDGRPSTDRIVSGYYPVVELAQWFADTIKRLEEEEGVPIVYTSIAFAESVDLLP
jgi:hypothetical protein